MKKEEIPFVAQLVKALEETEIKLEEFYNKKDYNNFDKAKEFIIKVQQKINESLR